jgi:thiol:disulfide interchange protein DsbC
MRNLIFILVLLLMTTSNAHAGDSDRWFTEEQVKQGSALFQQYCASCHGQNAEATSNWKQPDSNGNYPPPPLNGTAHTWHHAKDSLKRTIVEGGVKIGGVMPAFGNKLTDPELDAVVAYFQSFWTNSIYKSWASRNSAGDIPSIGNIDETVATATSANNDNMTELLKLRLGSGNVTEPVKTPVQGIFEVQYGSSLGYLSQDGRYLFMGNLIDLKQGQNLTDFTRRKIAIAEINQVALQDKTVFAAIGEEKAVLNIFTDTSCPYCQKLHGEIANLQEAGISVHYLPYPRGGVRGPGYQTLKQVWCAKDRAEAMTIAKGHETGDLPAGDCENASLVDEGFALGKKVGVTGTPALFKSNGEMIQGYVPYQQLIPQVLNN